MVTGSLIYAILAAVLIGISKSGLKGIGVLVVLLMALTFEAKASTGVLLPLLITADILAVSIYYKNVVWPTFFRLMPFMIVGVIVATIVGDMISLAQFRRIMAVIIVLGACLMLFVDRFKWREMEVPPVLTVMLGFVIGFTTMLGNLAGPFTNLYFIAGKFPKDRYIATTAMLFFTTNLIKVPFHFFVWETIHWDSLRYNLWLTPLIFIGFVVGYRILKYFSNEAFKKYVIAMTILGGLIMLLN